MVVVIVTDMVGVIPHPIARSQPIPRSILMADLIDRVSTVPARSILATAASHHVIVKH